MESRNSPAQQRAWLAFDGSHAQELVGQRGRGRGADDVRAGTIGDDLVDGEASADQLALLGVLCRDRVLVDQLVHRLVGTLHRCGHEAVREVGVFDVTSTIRILPASSK